MSSILSYATHPPFGGPRSQDLAGRLARPRRAGVAKSSEVCVRPCRPAAFFHFDTLAPLLADAYIAKTHPTPVISCPRREGVNTPGRPALRAALGTSAAEALLNSGTAT